MHRSLTMARRLALTLVLVLGLAACGGGDAGSDESGGSEGAAGGSEGGGQLISEAYDLSGVSVRLGSKDFTEQLILGQLAKQAWEAAGATVDLTENLPSPAGAREALLAGELDAAWEYTGTAYINYLGHDQPIDDPMEQFEAVKEEDLEKNDIFWTEPAPFDDTYGIATRRAFADENGLSTLQDVADFIEQNPDPATLCLDSTFATRDDGLVRFEENFDVDWPDNQLTEQEFAVIYQSTADGQPCNFGEVFTTDGRIQSLDLALMEDNENTFISYLSAVQIANDVYEENQDLAAVIETITPPLDEARMTELNALVDVDGEFPEDAAAQYLQEEGFIE
ncbi:MAG TPA: glycine betaine ABC transporter substrate-binding protein [Euzebyales bacterium]|nr:glycine betaine ABC transporter substrate-binding protein [Euzebyales bacterium]